MPSLLFVFNKMCSLYSQTLFTANVRLFTVCISSSTIISVTILNLLRNYQRPAQIFYTYFSHSSCICSLNEVTKSLVIVTCVPFSLPLLHKVGDKIGVQINPKTFKNPRSTRNPKSPKILSLKSCFKSKTKVKQKFFTSASLKCITSYWHVVCLYPIIILFGRILFGRVLR